MPPLTIGITTRNRPAALRRCVASIRGVLGASGAALELIVFDDNSDVPAAEQLGDAAAGLRVIRDARGVGYVAGRNALVSAATHDLVLLLDDDAVLMNASAVDRAMAVMERDARVGAIAFAQAEPDGRPWPESMQAGRGTLAATVPSFIGFAHLIRRSLFLEQGGYRSDFVFYGEEKDYCLRLLEAGYRVVYLPDALIGHIIDPGQRDQRRYVRFVIRNDLLQSFYNEPWPLVAVGLPIRLLRYRRMAASIDGGDAGGLRWIVGELRRSMPEVRRRRRPVSWGTIREWRRLSRTVVPYEAGSP
jgi:GT2 family glycosyltransferase